MIRPCKAGQTTSAGLRPDSNVLELGFDNKFLISNITSILIDLRNPFEFAFITFPLM